MTEQFNPRFPQFYLTQSAPCPYLTGRRERKVFTRLSGEQASALNDTLTIAGFRRSQNIAYKPACESCTACVSVRILASAFIERRSHQRIRARNADIVRQRVEPWATEEQFQLLRRYLDSRHKGGGMSDMSMFDYVAMVEDTAVRTRLIEYRRRGENGAPGRLVGVALTDRLSDGLSMVYSFFDPDMPERSLGTFMVLDHVDEARGDRLPHVYLGYWVEGCRKMSYKTRFQPLEALTPDGWRAIQALEKPAV
ncbi:MAG: arginyltransferase [Alphaproteobacteria bacterium]|nr:arginyltransferase [Alphaproteobacteria bacterium]